MADLNSLTNVAASYPNVFVEGSEIYLGLKGTTKRIKLYPVAFEWFDGNVTNLDWTECQFVDAYLFEISKYFGFIEKFISGEFPVRSEHWAKVCDVINDCFLRYCVGDLVQTREYELLMSSTYRIESDGRTYRNDLHPRTPIISDTLRLNKDFGWMFSDTDSNKYSRDLILSHNSQCNEESLWTEEKYASIGDDIADKIIYTLVKFDFHDGIDWGWILDACSQIDPRLGDCIDAYRHPVDAPKAGIAFPDEITLEAALRRR
jgi:hypothetical protein